MTNDIMQNFTEEIINCKNKKDCIHTMNRIDKISDEKIKDILKKRMANFAIRNGIILDYFRT